MKFKFLKLTSRSGGAQTNFDSAPRLLKNDLQKLANKLASYDGKALDYKVPTQHANSPTTAVKLFEILSSDTEERTDLLRALESITSSGAGQASEEFDGFFARRKFNNLVEARERIEAYFCDSGLEDTASGKKVSGLEATQYSNYILSPILQSQLDLLTRALKNISFGKKNSEGRYQQIRARDVLQTLVDSTLMTRSLVLKDHEMDAAIKLTQEWTNSLPTSDKKLVSEVSKLITLDKDSDELNNLMPSKYVRQRRQETSKLHYEGINYAVDVAIFAKDDNGEPQILMIQKNDGLFHLIGGFVENQDLLNNPKNSFANTAQRETAEEVKITDSNGNLLEIKTGGLKTLNQSLRGDPVATLVNDPRNDTVSQIHSKTYSQILAIPTSKIVTSPGTDTGEVLKARFVSVKEILRTGKVVEATGEEFKIFNGHIPIIFDAYEQNRMELEGVGNGIVALGKIPGELENSGDHVMKVLQNMQTEIDRFTRNNILGTARITETVRAALCKIASKADLALHKGEMEEVERLRTVVSVEVARETIPRLLTEMGLSTEIFKKIGITDLFEIVELFMKRANPKTTFEASELGVTPYGVTNNLKEKGILKETDYFFKDFGDMFADKSPGIKLSDKEREGVLLSLLIINAAWKTVQYHRAIAQKDPKFLTITDEGNFQNTFAGLVGAMMNKAESKLTGTGDDLVSIDFLTASRATFELGKDLGQIIKAI